MDHNIPPDTPWTPTPMPANFLLRQHVIEAFFLRISEKEKLNLLLQLCDTVSADLTAKWRKYINVVNFDKMRGYTTLQHRWNRTLFDNNRMMSNESVINTVKEYVDWFRHLDDDTQLYIFLTLLRMGGLGISQNVCWYIRRKYRCSKEIYEDKQCGGRELKVLQEISSQCLVKTYEEVLDPNDPLMAEVIQNRKQWKILMDAYHKEVEENIRKLNGLESTEIGKKGKGKKDRKKDGKKSSKKSKKTSSKESSSKKSSRKKNKKNKKSGSKKSSSKKSGKKKNAENICVDFLQLLPNNVVKKIFHLLDKKTLAVAVKVNSYWKYAVGSLNEDIKARKMLDKVIEEMKKDLKPIEIVQPNTSHPQKINRFDRLDIEGTCSKAIRTALNEFGGEEYNTSIKQIAIQKLPEYYSKPVYNLVTETRKFSTESPYKMDCRPKCVKHEAGVKIREPIDTLKPFGNMEILTRMQIINPQNSYESLRGTATDESQSSFYFQPTEDENN